MKIIPGNTAIRELIPNTLATVAGEPTWYEKMYPYLEKAEQWLSAHITGDTVLSALEREEESNPIKRACAQVITAQALMDAIPSLDLVLTPNGFGIVSTQNVVPASKDRIERLINSVEAQRDNAIDELLFKLPTFTVPASALTDTVYNQAQSPTFKWLDTNQGKFFASTLFPRLTLCRKLAIFEHSFVRYHELHARLVKIEKILAETYFSEELMEDFRQIVIKQQSPASQIVSDMILRIQSLELMLVSDLQVHQQSFFDLVQTIREHAELFPKWHASATAKLYSPAVFLNEKESKGYWF